jgi:hypothetical protein
VQARRTFGIEPDLPGNLPRFIDQAQEFRGQGFLQFRRAIAQAIAGEQVNGIFHKLVIEW